MKNDLDKILADANAAKERLETVANQLEQAGYSRKAASCRSLIFKIEEWQNRR